MWVRRYVHFHGRRHPRAMGAAEVAEFLDHLADERRVAPSTHNQARSALRFLYRELLGERAAWVDDIPRVRQQAVLPTVLSVDGVRAVLAEMCDVPRLIALLMYGSGLRLTEACALRVQDVDLARRQIFVRDERCQRHRLTRLSDSCATALAPHIEAVVQSSLTRATASATASVATPSGTRSRCTSSRWVTTSGSCRSCSGIET